MATNKSNGTSNIVPPTRLERLLRDRLLRKSSKAPYPNEATDTNRGTEPFEDKGEICEKQEARPTRQRLLVVANRLPVSAIRSGEVTWSLEISAGGLVSALLGKLLF